MDLIQLLSFSTGFVILISVVFLIRQRRLKEKFSLLWLFSSLAICLLALSRWFLDEMGIWLGVHYPPALLFLFGTFFLLAINISFSVTISELSSRIDTLAQHLALLEAARQQPGPGSSHDHELP